MVTAASLAESVTRALHGVGCANGRTRLQPELGRRLARRIGRHHEFRIRGHGAGAQIGEEDVEGHHLGERGRGPRGHRGLLMQDAARVHIDHDGRSDGAAARALLGLGRKRRTRRRRYRKCEQKRKPRMRPRPTKTFELSELHPSPKACSAPPPSFRIPYRTQETRALAQLAGATWFGRRLKSGDCQSVKADKFDLLCSAKIFVDRLLCNAYIRFTTLGSFFPERAYNAQRFRRVSESG